MVREEKKDMRTLTIQEEEEKRGRKENAIHTKSESGGRAAANIERTFDVM